MRRAVRAIVVKDNKILVMKRNKFGHVYYTLAGGRIEPGESPEQALLREIYEETGLTIKINRQIYLEHAGLPYGDQLVYICDYIAGEPALQLDSDEALINNMGKNLYEPMWLPIKDLTDQPFRSTKLAELLAIHLDSDFPDHVIEFST